MRNTIYKGDCSLVEKKINGSDVINNSQNLICHSSYSKTMWNNPFECLVKALQGVEDSKDIFPLVFLSLSETTQQLDRLFVENVSQTLPHPSHHPLKILSFANVTNKNREGGVESALQIQDM